MAITANDPAAAKAAGVLPEQQLAAALDAESVRVDRLEKLTAHLAEPKCKHCGYWDVSKYGVCNNCGERTEPATAAAAEQADLQFETELQGEWVREKPPAICACGHRPRDHSVIDDSCRYPGCKCNRFHEQPATPSAAEQPGSTGDIPRAVAYAIERWRNSGGFEQCEESECFDAVYEIARWFMSQPIPAPGDAKGVYDSRTCRAIAAWLKPSRWAIADHIAKLAGQPLPTEHDDAK